MCVSEKKVEHTDKARGYSRVGGEGGDREGEGWGPRKKRKSAECDGGEVDDVTHLLIGCKSWKAEKGQNCTFAVL